MYKINKGFITQKSGKKITIFDPEKSVLYTFNNTAAFIFNKLQSGWDEDKIVDAVTATFSVARDQAKKDLIALVKELKNSNIIS